MAADEDVIKDGNYDPHVQTDKDKVDYAPKGVDTTEYRYYPDNPESTLNKYRFAMKDHSQYYDPCQESAKMSFKCLELNDYDRDQCKEYFDAYRECKKQWLEARRKDRTNWS
ncbi:hypothetical protein B1J92_I02728g [Nakaseomyces glabratus]|nr:hypothetical protein B1J91_I02728g [Nakaseomyces glabratus]OXB49424.1 hypothetical protein B1J92_I02728g [Nakaseomyces glabratus]